MTSARSSSRSRPATTCTCTTSRRNAGREEDFGFWIPDFGLKKYFGPPANPRSGIHSVGPAQRDNPKSERGSNPMAIKRKVMAYRRENGRVGVRNHVIILPVDDISNACVEKVAAMVPGTLPLPHAYGRLQFGEDLELHFRTMIGTGSNPNVAACIVIGIEPGWTQRIVDGIKKTGKPVVGFSIEGRGDLKTAAEAAFTAQKFLQDASELQRT